LLLYTDGAPEAANPRDDVYGEDRLIQDLNEFRDRDGDETLEAIQEKLRHWVESEVVEDDVTLLLIDATIPGGD